MDSTPLALILQRLGISAADSAREWGVMHRRAGSEFVVPEIVDYEERRELKRLRLDRSIRALDDFIEPHVARLLPLGSKALSLASTLWADARRNGRPTAGPHSLDIDVILASQVLTGGFDLARTIVATSNLKHVGQFVRAAEWSSV